MQLSNEQQLILEQVRTDSNIEVDAVAGTGKTTLVLNIAKDQPSKNMLQITYNKSLKFEVREKVIQDKVENLTIHTYHSLAVKYYSPTSHVDNEIKKIVDNNTPPLIKIPKYDTIFIDEAQMFR